MAAVPIHASGSGLPFPTEKYPQMKQVFVREVKTRTIRTLEHGTNTAYQEFVPPIAGEPCPAHSEGKQRSDLSRICGKDTTKWGASNVDRQASQFAVQTVNPPTRFRSEHFVPTTRPRCDSSDWKRERQHDKSNERDREAQHQEIIRQMSRQCHPRSAAGSSKEGSAKGSANSLANTAPSHLPKRPEIAFPGGSLLGTTHMNGVTSNMSASKRSESEVKPGLPKRPEVAFPGASFQGTAQMNDTRWKRDRFSDGRPETRAAWDPPSHKSGRNQQHGQVRPDYGSSSISSSLLRPAFTPTTPMRDLPESHHHRLPDPQSASHTSTGSSLLQPVITTTFRLQNTAQSKDQQVMKPATTGIMSKPHHLGLNKSNRARLQKILAPLQDKLQVDQSEWSRFKLWTEIGEEGPYCRTPSGRKRSSPIDEARILFRIKADDFFYYIQGGDDREKNPPLVPEYVSAKMWRRRRAVSRSSVVETDMQARFDRLQRFVAQVPSIPMDLLKRYPLLAGVAFRAIEGGASEHSTSKISGGRDGHLGSSDGRFDQNLRRRPWVPGEPTRDQINMFCKRFMRIVDRHIKFLMKEVAQEQQTTGCVALGGKEKKKLRKPSRKVAKVERKALKRSSETSGRQAKKLLRAAKFRRMKRALAAKRSAE